MPETIMTDADKFHLSRAITMLNRIDRLDQESAAGLLQLIKDRTNDAKVDPQSDSGAQG